MIDRNELIEVVTRQVLATLSGQPHDQGLENAPQMVANGAARLGYCGNGADVPKDLAQYIDHTLLRPDASPRGIAKRSMPISSRGSPAVVRTTRRNTGASMSGLIGFPSGPKGGFNLMSARILYH